MSLATTTLISDDLARRMEEPESHESIVSRPRYRKLDRELTAKSAEFENAHPKEILAWAVQRFGSRLAVATSFQDAVLLDMATRADPNIQVVFLDTGAHFSETLEYVELLRQRYGVNLTVTTPPPEADEHPCGSDRCCEFRKVQPLTRSLHRVDAWVSGVKRVDGPTRATMPILSIDTGATAGFHPRAKINPLATWTDGDVSVYVKLNQLPLHPLSTQGYPSIGCAPTTKPVAPGDDPRAGRWADSTKTECGLHA